MSYKHSGPIGSQDAWESYSSEIVGFAYNHQPRHETEDMVKVFQPVVGFSSVEQKRERKKE